ncbi:hypothetical protein FSP39_010188 [Pinctada imbricata]|uniref:Rho guanine nucleotide exchange factor 3 n=1 Tax=Pinctada imbricata TaxID=66713 RepID=A0AA88YJ09_PINIB|nr:hypothetical protein FSP39_010188 [Pinctada imbricata]
MVQKVAERLTWDYIMGQGKRKRKDRDEDTLSIQSYDVTKVKKKTRRSLMRMSSSIANLLSPIKPSKKENEFQRSTSFKVPCSPSPKHNVTPYKAPSPSPVKRRLSRTWSEMISAEGSMPTELTQRDIKRQEAIYELYQGENDLVEDLNIVKKTYRDSMEKLKLMTEWELDQIFGPVDQLIPIHEDLSNKLLNERLPNGTTQDVGSILLEWAPRLRDYVHFCANQVFGKALLDEKKNDPSVDDFLQRCQDSPFSRKLDLWTLLDGARSKFMKYPLLLRTIHKYTDKHEKDSLFLEKAIGHVEHIIRDADEKTGEAKCRFYASRITSLYEDKLCEELEKSHMLICNGTLKNNKGTKLQVFLFDNIFVVTRLVQHGGHQNYQIYRQPIPLRELKLENLKDGEVKVGSFRGAFGNNQTAKNVFRVSFKDSSRGQSHTLIATDEHSKRQWMQCLQTALDNCPIQEEDPCLERRSEPDGKESDSSLDEKHEDNIFDLDVVPLSDEDNENVHNNVKVNIIRKSSDEEVKCEKKSKLRRSSSVGSQRSRSSLRLQSLEGK